MAEHLRLVIEGDARSVQAAARQARAAIRGLGTETDGLTRRGGALSAMATRQAQTLQQVGRAARNVGFAAGGVLAIGIAAAARSGIAFEKEMSRVKAVTQASGREMATLNALAIKLGRDTKFSAGEAASGMYQLASAGFKVGQIHKALPGVLDLAAASNIDLAAASEISSNVLNAFGLEAAKATHVADVMAATVNRSSVEMGDLQLSMKYIAPVAKSTGQSLEQMMAAVAVMGDRGIKGEMAGTALGSGLQRLVKPTKDVKKGLRELGLEVADLYGPKGLKPLPELVGLLEEGTEKLTKAEKASALARVFGLEAFKGMFNVVDAGPDKLEKLTRAFERSDGTARKASKTMMDNVSGSYEQLAGSAETAAIVLFQKASPMIRRALDGATEDLNEFLNALQRDPGFKSGDDIFGALKRAFDASSIGEDLKRELGKVDFAEALETALDKSIPVAAEAGAKLAIAGSKAFAKAFYDGDALTKLALGAFFITKFVGWKAVFALLGRQSGTAFAGGMSQTAGKVGFLSPAAKQNILVAAAVTGALFTNELSKKIEQADAGDSFGGKVANTLGDIAGKAVLMLSPLTLGIKSLSAMNKALRGTHHDATKAGEALRKGTSAGAIEAARDIEFLSRGGASSMTQLRRVVSKSMAAISASMGSESEAGRKQIDRTFSAAIQNVKQLMKEGVLTTEQGTRKIFSLMAQSAKALGVSKPVQFYIKNQPKDPQGIPPRLARGGMVQFGRQGDAGRDEILTRVAGREVMVGSGEVAAVLTRHQQAELNARLAPEGGLSGFIAKRSRPHYMASGGVVGDAISGALPSPSGGVGALTALGRWMRAQGYMVGENAALGDPPAPGVHAPGGFHYKFGGSGAIDVNADGRPGGEGAWLDRLAAQLKSAGWHFLWRVADHFDHMHVDLQGGAGGSLGAMVQEIARVVVGGPDSVTKELMQGSLDATRNMANEHLQKLAGESGGIGTGFSGPWVQVLEDIAAQQGWNTGDWKALVQKESGGNPAAVNPSSGAFGLGQFLGSTKDAYAKYGATSSDGADQIRAMAQYIKDRYKNPTAALAFHNANNYYERGGVVGGDGGSIADVVFAATGMPPVGTGAKEQKGTRARGADPKVKKPTALATARRWARKGRAFSPLAASFVPKQLISNYDALVSKLDNRIVPAIGLAEGQLSALGEEYLVDHDEDPDTPDVVNQDGMTVGRRGFVPGIKQAVAKMEEILALQTEAWAAKVGQRTLVTRAVEILNEETKKRTEQWRKMRDQVRKNAARITSVKGEIRAIGSKKKPDKGRLKTLRSELNDLHAAQRTLTGTDEPDPAALQGESGGALGRIWQQRDDFKSEHERLKDAPLALSFDLGQVDLDIGAVRRRIFDATGTMPPKPDTPADSGSGIADLLREQLRVTTGNLALSEATLRVFEGFKVPGMEAGLGGFDRGGLIGAFAHGIKNVPRTGIALLHAGETVSPAAEGPYGNQLRPYGSETSAGPAPQKPPVVNVHVHGDPTGIVRVVRAEIDGYGVQAVSRQLGRDSRQLVAAPGRP